MNEPSVSINVEHEDDDNWLQVEDDVLEGGGPEELDISLFDPEFELFSNDDDGQSETDDEDISLLRETVINKKARRQKEIELEKAVGCSEEAGSSVNHRASYSSHAPFQLDRMTMIPTTQMRSEPILPAQNRATSLTPLIVATAQAGQAVVNRGGTAVTIEQR
ncbi:hypothetical protein Cgig2_033900 [Carnegiea gigantea]|uniref:Uncharacterized protein n=1 Tax=Carnegiea gigantea TaxID=171969 RepID=A0A9Q1GIX0_9CARY|nr:hypothetical protein Cgig2_033900 [Carnegiea gigantea]